MKRIGITAIVLLIFFLLLATRLRIISCKAPNIILVTIDTLRPDHLGCYGYKRNTSPNIDSLAKKGVVFTEVIAQSSHTLASVPSFITSTYPYMHFVEQGEHHGYLNPAVKSLPDVLRVNGYLTGIFSDHPTHFGRLPIVKKNSGRYVEIETNNPDRLTSLALQWLNENKNKKFFLWLYFFGVHGPYSPSLPYSEVFYKDDLSKQDKYLPIAADDNKEIFGFIPKHISEQGITSVNYYISKYDGKIHVIDNQIGLLLEEIKRLKLDDNTIIILFSDHGESLGEHNLYFRHGKNLYDELLKVPLIISYPCSLPRGKKIDYQVQLLDVVPTILDILNVPYNADAMEGTSLKPYLLGNKNYIERYAFSNSGIFYSVRKKGWKLIYNNFEKIKEFPSLYQKFSQYQLKEYELYNLNDDSLEIHNLYVGGHKTTLPIARVRLIDDSKIFKELKQKLSEYVVKAEQCVGEAWRMKTGIDALDTFDEETKNRLKSLGYNQ